MSDKIIEMENVSKWFGDFQVLKDINLNVSLKQKIVVFIIGGKLKTKKWPSENWIKLANLIGKDYEIIIIGGPLEEEEAKHIRSQTKNSHIFVINFQFQNYFTFSNILR